MKVTPVGMSLQNTPVVFYPQDVESKRTLTRNYSEALFVTE